MAVLPLVIVGVVKIDSVIVKGEFLPAQQTPDLDTSQKYNIVLIWTQASPQNDSVIITFPSGTESHRSNHSPETPPVPPWRPGARPC